MHTFFLETDRIGFSRWTKSDMELAVSLWGDPEVTKYICASGIFTRQDIEKRIDLEVENERNCNVQYWPIFDKETGKLLGCCGLRPFKNEKDSYELGFHLCKSAWGYGYATEAAKAVIRYAFETLQAKTLYAGHHPENAGSGRIMRKLGFTYIGDNYYEPTGLYHPSYEVHR